MLPTIAIDGHGLQRLLGWRSDPDWGLIQRFSPALLAAAPLSLPDLTDLEAVSPPAYDQGRMGSCTIHAVYGAFEIKERYEGHDFGTPARLFGYQMELGLQGTWGQDVGSTIPTGMRVALAYGLPPEKDYAYSDDAAALVPRPPHLVYALGRQRRANAAMEVAVPLDHDHIVAALASHSAIACGFPVPQSFLSSEVARTGRWNGPAVNDPIAGGHAVAIVGHRDSDGIYKIRNSWSPAWGLRGHVIVPQAVVHEMFQDLMAVVDAPK